MKDGRRQKWVPRQAVRAAPLSASLLHGQTDRRSDPARTMGGGGVGWFGTLARTLWRDIQKDDYNGRKKPENFYSPGIRTILINPE